VPRPGSGAWLADAMIVGKDRPSCSQDSEPWRRACWYLSLLSKGEGHCPRAQIRSPKYLVDLKDLKDGERPREGTTDSETPSHVRLTESSEILPHWTCSVRGEAPRWVTLGSVKGGRNMPNLFNRRLNKRFTWDLI